MPMFMGRDREQIRQTYGRVWEKHQTGEVLEPLETIIAEVIHLHPEYHTLLQNLQDSLDKDWLPEGGETNPFLHMGLHIAIREQVSTNLPPGINEAYQNLLRSGATVHDAEHQMMECLAESLWIAQRNGLPPNEQTYLESVRRLAGMR